MDGFGWLPFFFAIGWSLLIASCVQNNICVNRHLNHGRILTHKCGSLGECDEVVFGQINELSRRWEAARVFVWMVVVDWQTSFANIV